MLESTLRKCGLAALFVSSLSLGAVVRTTGGPDTAPTIGTLSGAVMTGGGSALPGVAAGIAARVMNDTPLYAGAEVGLFLSASSPSYFVFPLLANLHYQFPLDSTLHPLIGVMAGPFLSTGGGFSTARFGLLFRPGVNIELGRSAALNVEARFGVLDSVFVVVPLVGATFSI